MFVDSIFDVKLQAETTITQFGNIQNFEPFMLKSDQSVIFMRVTKSKVVRCDGHKFERENFLDNQEVYRVRIVFNEASIN